jgi:hypothetical protein
VEPEADPERDQRTVFAYQVDSFYYVFMSLKCKLSIDVINVFFFVCSAVMNLVIADASESN